MSTVVDEDLMKAYEDQRKAELNKTKEKDGSSDENTDWTQEKENFAKQQYGENARVEGNKILDEKGEVIREFTNDEAWINEMAAADATLQAAEAMKEIPGVIAKNMETVISKFDAELGPTI
jgi:uncharacterized protein with gpF-like domain